MVEEEGEERKQGRVDRKERKEGVVNIHSVVNIYLWYEMNLPGDLSVVTR